MLGLFYVPVRVQLSTALPSAVQNSPVRENYLRMLALIAKGVPERELRNGQINGFIERADGEAHRSAPGDGIAFGAGPARCWYKGHNRGRDRAGYPEP